MKRTLFMKTALLLFLVFLLCSLSGCTNRNAEARSLYEKGLASYGEGDFDEALESFSGALDASFGEVSDFTADLLRYRAECELRLGDIDSAKSHYEALLALSGNKEESSRYEELLLELENLNSLKEADALFENEEYDAAAEIYKSMASLQGTYSGRIAWLNEAVTMEYLGDFNEASILFEEYLGAFPDDEAAEREYRFVKSRSDY